MNNYYVYLHKKLDTGEVFYVGKGMKRRAWVIYCRNKHWKNIVDKHGYTVEILFDNLTNEEALCEEISVISELRYFGYNLCNYTNGGEGTSGYSLTEEHKAKISKANKGRIKTEEWRDNLSKSQKGRPCNRKAVDASILVNKGKKLTAEQLERRRLLFLDVDMTKDKNIYCFINKDFSDHFIGTRKELATKLDIPLRKLNTLFQKKPNRFVYGWCLLRVIDLMFIKEYINAN